MRARGKTKRIPDGEAAGVNIEQPTSNNHHRKPKTAARRKSRRKSTWISLPAQKRGLEAGLWYQGMSRVVPGCPQTSPGAAGDGSCIRYSYGGHGTLNPEP